MKVSILTPCFNEAENVEKVYHEVKEVFEHLPGYAYEHVFIDNDSRDGTQAKLREIAAQDRNVKLILNARNFGAVRSGYYGLLQCDGAAVITLVADLQDPPQLIPKFIAKWEEGAKVVVGVIRGRHERFMIRSVRHLFYKIINRVSETELIEHFTGFGLYDRAIIDVLRKLDDPYPYFRGLISELGWDIEKVEYIQAPRYKGRTSTNFYHLYNIAMLGITNYSKIPLRLAILFGFLTAFMSMLVAAVYLVYKLLYWESFRLGMAPVLIGFFFLSSLQLIFLGLIAEYIGSIHTQVMKKPLVIERERVNFDISS